MAQIRRRALQSGGVSYEVRVHRRGSAEMSKSFASLAAAKAWANATEGKIDKGERVSRRSEKTSIGEALADFLALYQPRTGSSLTRNEKLRVEAINHDLGKIAVAKFHREHVENYITRLLKTQVPPPQNRKKVHYLYAGAIEKTYSPTTVRKFYFQLKKCLEWHSLRERYYLDHQLFKGHVVPPAWGGQRDRRLEPGEEESLYASADRGYTHQQAWKNIIAYALETGMRAQEILLSTWDDVNFPGRTINIPQENVKTRTFRQIPLSRRAIEILRDMESLRQPETERIFWQWNNSDVLARGFRRICHRLELAPGSLRFHDLRHEAISRFFERGRLSDMEIMKISGHSQHSTLAGYLKLRPSNLADKMD